MFGHFSSLDHGHGKWRRMDLLNGQPQIDIV
jgi:hypothetical protein